jgi:hypothetical protein
MSTATETKTCICQREATHEAHFRSYRKGEITKSYYCTTHAIKGFDEYGITMYFIGTDEIDRML